MGSGVTVLAMSGNEPRNDDKAERRADGRTDLKAADKAGEKADDKPREDGVMLTPEQQRARRSRSLALAFVLAALVVLFYIVTLVKGPGVLVRPL